MYFYRELPKDSRSSSHFLSSSSSSSSDPYSVLYHRVEEEGEGERGGTTVWRKRERGRGVVPPCGGRVRGGEGWYHRVEEEGGGERGGTTVWRKREGRLFSICEITTCLIRGSMG